jgi:hypothetical protein
MKKLIIISALLILASGISKGSEGYQVKYNQPKEGIYELSFKLGDFELANETHQGIVYTKIEFSNHSIVTGLKGFAELPYLSATVQLPPDKNVDLKVISSVYTDYRLDYPVLPSRGTIYRDQNPSTVPYDIDDRSITNKLYPEYLAKNSSPFILKDVRGTSVYVYPFRYIAKKNILRVYNSITVQLKENNEIPENPVINPSKTILRGMAGIYNSVFINFKENKDDLTIGDYGDILVICTDRDEDAIEPYIQWKKEKGFDVFKEVVPTNTNVKNLVQQKYDENNDILFVQLVGDWEDIKSDLGTSYNAPMDPQLGCVVGTDEVADITVGRISANSPADVSIQVNKIINYEKNPEAGAGWYSSAIGIGSDQGPGDDNEYDKDHEQIIWDNKLDPFTYETYTPIYDPGATAQMVSDAVNSGAGIINYTGHGNETSWGTTGFSNSDISNLSNGNKLPWIISVACDNGDFHTGTCFSEAWLRKENGGAVMTLMSSISQPWNPPMRGQDYIADIITGGYDYTAYPNQNGISTTEQRSFTGPIIFNSLALMTTESGTNDDWKTIKTWTIFGDPSMQLRTKAPADINLSNTVIMVGADFQTIITCPNGPVKGAMVALSQNNNYFSGITDATGTVTISHQLEPGPAKLVVTGFNTETIYEDITVVPADGPYVTVDEFTIDDSQGNANGLADFGESVKLDLSAKNVGSENTTGVTATLSSDDAYITITDNSYTFGDIAAGQSVQGDDAFAFTIADNIPDQHSITFEIAFTGSSKETWTSTIYVLGNAPGFSINELTIDDSGTGNGDGILDPGETADIHISTTNFGHASAPSTTATLSASGSDLTINTSSYNFSTLQAGTTAEAVFNVTADASVPTGTPVNVDYSVSSGSYTNSETLIVVIGEIPVYLIQNGTETLCIGKFFDTGGENGDYQINEDITCTLLPEGDNSKIKVNFISFNIEADYDFMHIYDGTDVNAPEIEGSPFTGSSSPGEIIATNDEGAITIHFISDNIITAPGWEADISCEIATEVNPLSNIENVNIYPNPASNMVFISSPDNARVSIYDLLGQKVKELDIVKGTSPVNISDLKGGIYIVQINSDRKTTTKKIKVKEGVR